MVAINPKIMGGWAINSRRDKKRPLIANKAEPKSLQKSMSNFHFMWGISVQSCAGVWVGFMVSQLRCSGSRQGIGTYAENEDIQGWP